MKLKTIILMILLAGAAGAQTYAHPVFGATPLTTSSSLGGDSLYLNVDAADSLIIYSSGDTVWIDTDGAGTITIMERVEFEHVTADTIVGVSFDTLGAYWDTTATPAPIVSGSHVISDADTGGGTINISSPGMVATWNVVWQLWDGKFDYVDSLFADTDSIKIYGPFGDLDGAKIFWIGAE